MRADAFTAVYEYVSVGRSITPRLRSSIGTDGQRIRQRRRLTTGNCMSGPHNGSKGILEA